MGGRRRTNAVSNDLFGHGLLSPLPEGHGEGERLLSARRGTPHPDTPSVKAGKPVSPPC